MLAKMVTLAVAALMLAACATDGPTRVEAEQSYLRHAGPELERVRYAGFVQGWRPVGNDSVLISFSRDLYYLFDLTPPCTMDIRQATRLRLKTTTPNSISRFDRIEIGGSSCRITRIREVDFKAAQAELKDRPDRDSEFERAVDHDIESESEVAESF